MVSGLFMQVLFFERRVGLRAAVEAKDICTLYVRALFSHSHRDMSKFHSLLLGSVFVRLLLVAGATMVRARCSSNTAFVTHCAAQYGH